MKNKILEKQTAYYIKNKK